MTVRLIVLLAYAAALFMPAGVFSAAQTTLIRICSVNGTHFAPLFHRNENEPQKRSAGCHAYRPADRPKIGPVSRSLKRKPQKPSISDLR